MGGKLNGLWEVHRGGICYSRTPVFGTAVLCLILAGTLGCNKMLAKYQTGKAQKRVEEANKNEASRFAPSDLEKTNAAINKATNEYNQQQFPAARQSAKVASDMSKQLLDQVKNLRAGSLRDDASKWLAIARLNQAQQEDTVQFNRIQAANEDGIKAYEKQKWDKAITVFSGVVAGIDHLLKDLETKAKQGLAESEKLMQELKDEGAEQYAPDSVEEMNQLIEKIRNYISVDYNYRAALTTRDQARQKEQEGILKTKEEKSKIQIRDIEDLLDQAVSLGAEIYAAQSFSVIRKEFEGMVAKFYDKQYDSVLSTAPTLKPRVEELIVETKREAARAKMEEVGKAIEMLSSIKGRSYLPGRVEQLEALLQEARKAFDAQDFTQSKKVAEQALDLRATIIEEFNTLAQKEIDAASAQLGQGEAVFGKMENIFDEQIPGPWTGDEAAVENSKQALKEELKSRLTNDRISLGVASVKREEKGFDVAIETARAVAKDSSDVEQQTYRIVAHNAILSIAREMSRYEAEGGRTYAPAELDKTARLLDDCKGLLKAGQYREAVRRASDTKAQLLILVQQLKRVAVTRIEDAKKAIEGAKKNRAEQFEGDKFNQAMVAVDRAMSALEGDGLKTAIESAIQSESIATEANTSALKQWTQELMGKADGLLAQAREAGADRYGPQQLQSAIDLRANLQLLYDQGGYAEAIEAGTKTVDAAEKALYAKVTDAENAIATAKRYQGWEFEPQRLAEAMVAVKNAREVMAEGHYNLAEQHAQQAITTAENVTRDARRKSFDSRMQNLTRQVELAREKGTGYYQVEDLVKLISEMQQLRAEFDPAKYDDVTAKLNLIDAQLASLMQMTPDVLDKLVVSMQNRMTQMEDHGAKSYMPDKMEEIERKIKYAQLDYRNEKFLPSYENARDAQALLDQVDLNLRERDYDAIITKEFGALNDVYKSFSTILNMGTPMMARLVVDPQGNAQVRAIIGNSSPSDVRTKIVEIEQRVRALKVPATRQKTQEAVLEMFKVAQTGASNFEKTLIMDQYDAKQAREIVEMAYLQIMDARKRQQQIQESLAYPQPGAKPAGVERVISSDN